MADNKSVSVDGVSESLAHSINAAILSSHTKINRLILDRMPRAVPPQTDNPSAYITGLLHFGAVYIAFESLWQNILGIHTEIAPIPYTYPFSSDPSRRDETPQITERTRHILEALYWPNMLRHARIKEDIRTMTGWPQHVVDEQIRSVGTTGRLGKFLAHVQGSISQKPHLLLAYAYGLYLALLSGGSYIRTELIYLKPSFWQAMPSPIRPNMIPCNREPAPSQTLERTESFGSDSSEHGISRNDSSFKMPLEFLDFDPPLGENPRQQSKDLKAEFKMRFTHAEQALNGPEREDIIKESIVIFQHLEEVVGQLDGICNTPQGKSHVARVVNQPPQTQSRTTTFGSRIRDSIAIAKGRLLRTRRKSSGASSVTAAGPSLAADLSIMFAASSTPARSDSTPLLSSSSSGEFKDAQSKQHSSQGSDSELGHSAVLPGEGFRTIRYDDGDPEKLYGGLDGAYDDIRRYSGSCPIARVSSAKESTAIVEREGPNYALYAMLSNLVVLAGIAMVFMAYLYARHGGIRAASMLDLRMSKD